MTDDDEKKLLTCEESELYLHSSSQV